MKSFLFALLLLSSLASYAQSFSSQSEAQCSTFILVKNTKEYEHVGLSQEFEESYEVKNGNQKSKVLLSVNEEEDKKTFRFTIDGKDSVITESRDFALHGGRRVFKMNGQECIDLIYGHLDKSVAQDDSSREQTKDAFNCEKDDRNVSTAAPR